MVEADTAYLRACIDAGLVQSPCLELGVGYDGPNNRAVIEAAGIEYFGSDIVRATGVDYVVDFEGATEETEKNVGHARFGSVLVLNVLEHTFEPIKVLDNVFHVLRPGGTCIVITPTVWPIHNYPIDCWRINPNFYEEYCKRRPCKIHEDLFEYVGVHHVRKTIAADGTYVLPSPSQGKFRSVKSRVVHKLFNTFGRGMAFPSHVATGVVMSKTGDGASDG